MMIAVRRISKLLLMILDVYSWHPWSDPTNYFVIDGSPSFGDLLGADPFAILLADQHDWIAFTRLRDAI